MGVPVSAVQIPEVIEIIKRWIDAKEYGHYLTLTGMHGVMEAYRNSDVLRAYNNASMVLPDGKPLTWLGRWHGHGNLRRRVYGPELMLEFCRQTGNQYRHFFYGGNEGVAIKLAERFNHDFQTNVVGTLCPPFGSITENQIASDLAIINASKADIVWIGVSTPKQDLLMMNIKSQLNASVMLGVGAAFDFNACLKPYAPRWMQEWGLEWFYRLLSEPRRLWRRYLILGPQFVVLATLDIMRQWWKEK